MLKSLSSQKQKSRSLVFKLYILKDNLKSYNVIFIHIKLPYISVCDFKQITNHWSSPVRLGGCAWTFERIIFKWKSKMAYSVLENRSIWVMNDPIDDLLELHQPMSLKKLSYQQQKSVFFNVAVYEIKR